MQNVAVKPKFASKRNRYFKYLNEINCYYGNNRNHCRLRVFLNC